MKINKETIIKISREELINMVLRERINTLVRTGEAYEFDSYIVHKINSGV
jgi:hypothetical protein